MAGNHTLSNSTFYAASEVSSQRSLTLPRRHRRHMSSESTFLISSRDCSPIRRRSPQCYNGSLPRSTHSIPNSARSPKRQPLVKQMSDDQSRAKSAAEVYKNRNAIDNKIASEREKHKSIYSGPSSLESGKVSTSTVTPVASGPSSIDSGKFPYSRTSGHSSLESNSIPSTNRSMTGSPKMGPKRAQQLQNLTRKLSPEIEIGIPNSQSNNSITLQVTNNQGNNMPSTKIFVQNSPVRSVITFENGKIMDNSNVYIINSEKTAHANGEVTTNKTISHHPPTRNGVSMKSKANKENYYFSENETGASETGDSLSMISETSPDSSLTPQVNNDLKSPEMVLESNKFTKNIKNDNTMNNNRKLGVQTLSQNQGNGGSIIYKNVLKETLPSTPVQSPQNNNKNFFENRQNYEQLAGSVGNLKQLSQTKLETQKKLNSNSDLKNAIQYSENSHKTSNSLVNILRKNSEPNLAIKNTNEKDCLSASDKSPTPKKELINDRRLSLSQQKEINGKVTENGFSHSHDTEAYNFPSLTDLSFNFTSLAAQKILQGVSSINSIDTLCELSMQQQQQQQNQTQQAIEKAQNTNINGGNVCTDYGLV